MQYEYLSALSKPGARAVCEIDDEAPEGLSHPTVGPVVGRIVLTNTGSGISARGKLRATVRLECRRCLCPVEVGLHIDVNDDCALAQIDDPRAAEGDQIPLLDGTVVDLSELVRQLVSLTTPPHALCSNECRGLCPQCGVDRNRVSCECRTDARDPRLSGLQQLLGE